MSADKAFQTFKTFLETHPAGSVALRPLAKGVEIGVIIGDVLHCAVYQNSGLTTVEKRPAKNPDVEFHLKPEAIDIIANNSGEDMGDLAVAVIKQCVAGSVKIKVTGSFFSILRNGYLEIIKSGGNKLWVLLASRGITGLTKLTSLIKNLRKN